MPDLLSDSASYDAVYVPNGGDARNAASIRPGFQALTNRTAYAKNLLDTGVKRVRTFASLSAMRGAAAPSSGEHGVVPDYGLYQYISSSTQADDTINVIQPTAVSGAGRWHQVNRLTRGVPNGVAPLDSSGNVPVANLPAGDANGVAPLDSASKVPVANLHNAIPFIYYAAVPDGTYGSAGFVSGLSIPLALQAGDIVTVDGQFLVSANAGFFQVALRVGSTTIGGTVKYLASTVQDTVVLSGLVYQASASGTFDLKATIGAFGGTAQIYAESGGVANSFVRAVVVRP